MNSKLPNKPKSQIIFHWKESTAAIYEIDFGAELER